MLRTKKDFDNLFKGKTSYYSSFYTVHFSKNKVEHIRVGISVSKKLAKSAVSRNLARRQIKNILTNNIDYQKPVDILLVVKKNFFDADFLSKKKQLLELVNKILVNLN